MTAPGLGSNQPTLRTLPYTLLLSYLPPAFPHPSHTLLSPPARSPHPDGSQGSWELGGGVQTRVRKHKGRDCFLTSLHDATLQAS